jgi:hypothetical protein
VKNPDIFFGTHKNIPKCRGCARKGFIDFCIGYFQAVPLNAVKFFGVFEYRVVVIFSNVINDCADGLADPFILNRISPFRISS